VQQMAFRTEIYSKPHAELQLAYDVEVGLLEVSLHFKTFAMM
jgi:hypothetical protein